MALDPDAIHRALASQLAANIAKDWNFAPWPFAGEPAPCVEVWPDEGENGRYIDYFSTFGGNGVATLYVRLRVEVSAANAETVFKRMTDVLASGTGETSSIADAVNTDPTLGGVVRSATVLGCEWPANEGDLATVAWVPVRIVTNKSGAAA